MGVDSVGVGEGGEGKELSKAFGLGVCANQVFLSGAEKTGEIDWILIQLLQ